MMGLAKSTFYYNPSPSSQDYTDLDIRDMIENIQSTFPGYGYRRIYEHLLRKNIRINKKRLRRIMRDFNLYSCLKKLMKPRGTRTELKLRYPNLIRGLKLNAPNQVWATDITYIKLRKEFAYLSAIIDIYTRKIVGWSISKSLDHEFCLQSLQVAIKNENPPSGVIHHSDRGVQYVCEPYIEFLVKNKFKISMSAVGTPEDNAFIEAFFKTLKREEVYFKKYRDMQDVVNHLLYFIEDLYNKKDFIRL